MVGTSIVVCAARRSARSPEGRSPWGILDFFRRRLTQLEAKANGMTWMAKKSSD